MAYVPLADGTRVPWLAYGTGSALSKQDPSDAVRVAILNGVTHFDTAQAYQNEDGLGQALVDSERPRSTFFITTKLGALRPGQSVESALGGSLQKLRTAYVDLFLINNPAQHEGKLKDVWKGMERVKQLGLAKNIGVSNFTVAHLQEILEGARVVPAVNQIEYHPYLYRATSPIVKFCQERRIAIAAYGGLAPLARFPRGPVDPVLARVRDRVEGMRGSPVTVAQILLKWLQQQGCIVVSTSRKRARMMEYMDTVYVPKLTAEEIQLISDRGSEVHKRSYMHHVFNEQP